MVSWPLAAVLGLGFASEVRADLVLNLSSDVGANMEFQGQGTSATFLFNSNTSGTGFQITSSTGGPGDAGGLHGTLGGTFTYQTNGITKAGITQMASVSSSGGLLTITDNAHDQLTGTITGIDMATIGTGGTVDVSGAIDLSNVVYSGMVGDLVMLRNTADLSGGILVLTFQFTQPESLSQLAVMGADHKTSYSGSISTLAVPEPSSLMLAGMGMMSLLGFAWRRAATRA